MAQVDDRNKGRNERGQPSRKASDFYVRGRRYNSMARTGTLIWKRSARN